MGDDPEPGRTRAMVVYGCDLVLIILLHWQAMNGTRADAATASALVSGIRYAAATYRRY